MEIGKTLYAKDRQRWRKWLAANHDKADEIWLVTYKKHTNKPSIPYDHAVEEALCFGWIDSIVKRLDDDRTVQRFSPRRANSKLSELNAERARRLIASGQMTRAGLEKIQGQLQEAFVPADDILAAIKRDPAAWKNFKKLPDHYVRIRIGWIEGARKRPDIFQTRLNYFIKMTAKNKMFGSIR